MLKIGFFVMLFAVVELSAYAPQQTGNQPKNPYANPAYNQGLSPKDNTAKFNDGNLVRNVSDQAISNEIHNIITSGYFSQGYQNLSYSVNDGIVTLRGHVSRPENKLTIEDQIKRVNGVVLVNNQISLFNSDDKIDQN